MWSPIRRVPPAGREFVVEPYAPLAALRPASPGREHAWHAPDDRGPRRALWPLWTRHVAHRLRDRVGGPAPAVSPRARVVHQAPSPCEVPPTDLSDVSDRSDDENASSC